jgi:ADP-heptose:LPS heptosyltransferase
MMALREETLKPQRIAIFRALQLGDLLQAIPALRAIRAGFPGAEITLIGLPWAKSFTQRFHHYIDRFVEFVGFPGISEMEVLPERIAGFIKEQRAYAYDIAIQMHGSGRTSNRFILALGAKMTAGYYTGSCPERLTLSVPYPDNQPEVYRNLGLAKLLTCEDCNPRLEFPLCNQDRSEAVTLLSKLPRLNGPWIGIHAGARPSSRRWPVPYFAAIADDLALKYNAQIILTGSADEKEIVQAVEAHMKIRPLNVAGETSLGGLAALISELDLFVSNDTGPAHIANALDTPSITIFGPADHRRWAPLDQERHPIVRHAVECSPCSYSDCPIDHRCLGWLHPEMVMTVAERLLEGGFVSCGV